MPSSVAREADGGLKVGEDMKVEGKACCSKCSIHAVTPTLLCHGKGLENVYAAGDVASMTWPDSELWFQMRLWSQVRGCHSCQLQ